MRLAVASAVSVLAALLVAEFAMRPAMGTRLELALYLSSTALLAAAAAWILRRWARGGSNIGRTVFALSIVSVVVVAIAISAASGLMFISAHDLRLLWIVLGFALVIALIFAASVVRPLTTDLRQIAAAASKIGDGDLVARTWVQRGDEVGIVAETLDRTAGRLAALEAERVRDREARREFLTSIGHDLRTPLAALQVAVEAMQDGLADDPDRYLRAMERDVIALASLVDDLFVLARIESGQLDFETVTVDLSDLADEALEALRPIAAVRGVELVLEASGHVQARGSVPELGRVIRNLVDNAIKHSPSHGRVVVRVEGSNPTAVVVTDDGPGFRSEFIGQAFEGFTRDDEARTRSDADGGGAGLGLAIARGFIAAHGGTIWAEPGPGGRVAFTLPASVESGLKLGSG